MLWGMMLLENNHFVVVIPCPIMDYLPVTAWAIVFYSSNDMVFCSTVL